MDFSCHVCTICAANIETFDIILLEFPVAKGFEGLNQYFSPLLSAYSIDITLHGHRKMAFDQYHL
eukprot:747245-Hanusia_phi.AAC.4